MSEKLTLEQSETVFAFLKSLAEENVPNYWNLISVVDQSRVYGMYRAFINSSDSIEISFHDYVKDFIMLEQLPSYERVLESPGVAEFLRYTLEGEPQVLVLEDVKVPRAYITKTQERVYPVTLRLDSNYKNGELDASWKVRLYEDQFYKYLFEEDIPDYENERNW